MATLLAGCGQSAVENAMERRIEEETGGDADVDMQADGSMRVETAEGTVMTGPASELPENWPSDVPVYDDAQITFSGSASQGNGKMGTMVMLQTEDSVEDVVAYYKDEIVKQGWKIDATMQMGGSTVMAATKGSRVVSMQVAASGEGTVITLGIGEQ